MCKFVIIILRRVSPSVAILHYEGSITMADNFMWKSKSIDSPWKKKIYCLSFLTLRCRCCLYFSSCQHRHEIKKNSVPIQKKSVHIISAIHRTEHVTRSVNAESLDFYQFFCWEVLSFFASFSRYKQYFLFQAIEIIWVELSDAVDLI